MSISFENDNDIIVYALEKIISFCREQRLLFAAPCVWWLVSIIKLYQGLINHIDGLQIQEDLHTKRLLKNTSVDESVTLGTDRQDGILRD